MGLADKIVVRFGKGKPMPDSEDEDNAPDDESDEKPGMKGKMLRAALRKGDDEAIEEAVRAICG